MSHVTNVMIQFDAIGDADRDRDIPDLPSDFKNTEKVQEIVRRLASGQEFTCISTSNAGWGGQKVPECDLWAAAFNYLPLDEFLVELAKLDWAEPDRLRVFVQGQHDCAFGVWVLRDGKMVCVVKPERD